MGILNAIFAPFIVLYLIMYSFFRYFDVRTSVSTLVALIPVLTLRTRLPQEYHKNPSSIGGRKYTPFAEWKFREFNELPHHFIRRLDESYPTASMYIGQFPNEKLTIVMRFAAFIAGSFAAVLLLATVIDPDLFVGFEVTPHRTMLFYLGVFGSILAVARGMIPEENRVFDPELLIMEVIQDTHYMPDEWKDQLHSKKVRQLSSICGVTLTDSPIMNYTVGTPGVRRTVRDEDHDLRPGTAFRCTNPVRAVVLSPGLRTGDRRFLQGVHHPRGLVGVRL